MTEQTVSFTEAVDSAYQAVEVINAAWKAVLLLNDVPEATVDEIEQIVAQTVNLFLDGQEQQPEQLELPFPDSEG